MYYVCIAWPIVPRNLSLQEVEDMKKKAISVVAVVIMLFSLMPLFSTDDARFRFKHVINTEDECYTEFWQIGTTNTFPADSAEITTTAPTRFASLGVHYSGNTKYKITIGITPLYYCTTNNNNEKVFNTNYTYPYTFEVLETGTNDTLSTVSPGDRNITVGNLTTPYSYAVVSDDSGQVTTSLHSGTYALADFRITLDSNNASLAGQYVGFLLCWVETV